MPYNKIEDLPDNVKILPKAAQQIWLRVFNETLMKYKNENTAIRIAWTAVKNKYEKVEDTWRLKDAKTRRTAR